MVEKSCTSSSATRTSRIALLEAYQQAEEFLARFHDLAKLLVSLTPDELAARWPPDDDDKGG